LHSCRGPMTALLGWLHHSRGHTKCPPGPAPPAADDWCLPQARLDSSFLRSCRGSQSVGCSTAAPGTQRTPEGQSRMQSHMQAAAEASSLSVVRPCHLPLQLTPCRPCCLHVLLLLLLSVQVAGRRTVPVEVGSHYLAEGWGTQLMTLGDFIASIMAGGTAPGAWCCE
jgi:hypothetical protein